MIKEDNRTVSIFCASSPNVPARYMEEAFCLGRKLADNGYHVITGGGSMGLMASVEDGVLDRNGRITAIIPQFMIDAGWLHTGLKDVIVTGTMQERKQMMFDSSDAIITLPGGCGTLDELTEVLTFKQLGIMSCPVVIMNTNGYYDYFLKHLQRQVDEDFMRPEHLRLWSVASDPSGVISQLESLPQWDTSLGKLPQRE